MSEEKFEGIVLKSQDYQERHRIITLFSEVGLLSLIVKNISRKNARMLALTTVFTHAEYHVKRGRGELYAFADATLLDEHLSLRTSLAHIHAAASLTQAILSSQLPGKSSPALFHLYKSYLKQVPTFTDPATLLASFQIKLLKHEGLLHLTPHCSLCPEVPAQHIHDGESLCPNHSHSGTFRFSPGEWATLEQLHTAQQFSHLRTLAITPSVSTKIGTLFKESLSN